VVSVVFGGSAPNADINYSVDVIVNLLERTAVYIATGVVVGLFLLCNLFIWAMRRRGTARTFLENKLLCFVLGFTAGIFSGTTGFATKATVVCVENMWRLGSASDMLKWQFYCFLFGLPGEFLTFIPLRLRGPLPAAHALAN
jgi:hypothetical protein